MNRRSWCTAAALIAAILVSSVAEAQWVFLGRKALGAVSRLTTQNPDGTSSDVASVLIEARPDNVYATALMLLKDKPRLRITSQDEKARSVEFTDDKRIVAMKAIPMGDSVTQLLISSSGSSRGTENTPVAVDAVLRVCKEMKVACVLSE